MKAIFIYVAGGKEPYAALGEEVLTKKISGYLPLKIDVVKAVNVEDTQKDFKRSKETEQLLKKIDKTDYVILFDEKGELVKNSRTFAQKLGRAAESGRRIAFVMGGAYGVSEELKKRAQWVASLSPLTFNHHVAKIVALEQVYRGLSILKGHPYHND